MRNSKRLIAGILSCCMFLSAQTCLSEELASRARTLYQQGNYEEVIDLLAATETRGALTSGEAYYLGLSRKQTGQPDAAIATLKKALSLPSPNADAVVDLAYLLNSKNQDAEAATWIDWAEKRNIRPGDISYLKGIMLAKQGKSGAAIQAFTAAKKADPAFSQRADMQIALLQVRLNDINAAKASLNAVITSDPSSELAGFARDYSAKLESSQAGPKRWSLLAGINYQYDDNVVAKPSKTVTGVSFPKKNDSAINENLQLTYNTRTAGPWQLSAQYGLYNNNYSKRHEFDQLSNTLTLIPSYMTEAKTGGQTTPLVISMPVAFNYTHLDYKGYSNQVSVKPTATAILTPSQIGQFTVGYTRRNILGTPSEPAENRDAHLLNALLGYYYLFAENRGMCNLRGEFVFEGADGNNWRNNGVRVAADLLAPVTKTTTLILSADAMFKFYLVAPVTVRTNRRDNIYTAGVTLKQQIAGPAYLNLQYLHSTTSSNVAIYDYSRNVYLAGLEVRL